MIQNKRKKEGKFFFDLKFTLKLKLYMYYIPNIMMKMMIL